jgi:hypothetical protein
VRTDPFFPLTVSWEIDDEAEKISGWVVHVIHAQSLSSLRKNPFFEGCSKKPLPAAGRQMQVERCEIPLPGALEILSREAYLKV